MQGSSVAAGAARICVRKPRVFCRLRATPRRCLTTRSDPVRTTEGPGPPALAPPCVGVCAWAGRARELMLQAGGTHLCGDTAGGDSGLAPHWGLPYWSPVLGSPSAQAVLPRPWFLRTTGSSEGLSVGSQGLSFAPPNHLTQPQTGWTSFTLSGLRPSRV